MNKSTRICMECGSPFAVAQSYAERVNPRHCWSCTRRLSPDSTTTPCELCGTPVRWPKSRPKRYCSRSCYYEANAAERITKTCEVCERSFSIPAVIAERYTVCSWKCRTAGGEIVNCERCGKPFRRKPSEHRRRHCSEECYRPPHYITCATCGKRTRVVPANERRFCSVACYRRHVGETSLEARVREGLEELGLPFEQEKRVGRYSIDFALYFLGVALEADGTYWHQDKRRDARKERALAKAGWKVVRVTEDEIMRAPDVARLLRKRLKASLPTS